MMRIRARTAQLLSILSPPCCARASDSKVAALRCIASGSVMWLCWLPDLQGWAAADRLHRVVRPQGGCAEKRQKHLPVSSQCKLGNRSKGKCDSRPFITSGILSVLTIGFSESICHDALVCTTPTTSHAARQRQAREIHEAG